MFEENITVALSGGLHLVSFRDVCWGPLCVWDSCCIIIKKWPKLLSSIHKLRSSIFRPWMKGCGGWLSTTRCGTFRNMYSYLFAEISSFKRKILSVTWNNDIPPDFGDRYAERYFYNFLQVVCLHYHLIRTRHIDHVTLVGYGCRLPYDKMSSVFKLSCAYISIKTQTSKCVSLGRMQVKLLKSAWYLRRRE